MHEYLTDVYHAQFQVRCRMVFPAQCWLLRWYQKAPSRCQSLLTSQFPPLSEIYWLSSSPCVSTGISLGHMTVTWPVLTTKLQCGHWTATRQPTYSVVMWLSHDNQTTVWSLDCHMTTNLQCGHVTVTWLPTYSVAMWLSHDNQPTVWPCDLQAIV